MMVMCINGILSWLLYDMRPILPIGYNLHRCVNGGLSGFDYGSCGLLIDDIQRQSGNQPP